MDHEQLGYERHLVGCNRNLAGWYGAGGNGIRDDLPVEDADNEVKGIGCGEWGMGGLGIKGNGGLRSEVTPRVYSGSSSLA